MASSVHIVAIFPSARGLTVIDDTGAKLVDAVTFKFPISQVTAASGEVNAGAEAIAEVLAGLMPPASGSLQIGDDALYDVPEIILGRRVGYAGADT